MLLACSPENFTQTDMHQAQSGWQGASSAPSMEMYQHHPWYSQEMESNFPDSMQHNLEMQPNLEMQQQLQQILQHPGFQVDPTQGTSGLSMLWPEMHPGLAGHAGHGDTWQESSWYKGPAPQGSYVSRPDASSRCIMSTAPVDTSFSQEPLMETLLEKATKLDKRMKREVDEDFERDVTNAVAQFLQGDDAESDEDAEDDGSLPGSLPKRTMPSSGLEVPKNSLPSMSAEPTADNQQLLGLFSQFAKRLQKLLREPQGNTTPETASGSSDTVSNQSSETIRSELSDALKLLERLADKDGRTQQLQSQPILSTPSSTPAQLQATRPATQADPASKPSLQLEHLVTSSPVRRPMALELQRGQCLGVMLKMKPLPPGVTAAHMVLLKPRVEAIIKQLIHNQVPPTLTNITESLKLEGIGEPVNKALLNLCHIFSNVFCLWVPDAGEMSIILLEEPLPPVDDKMVEQLETSLANQLRKKLQAPTATNPAGANLTAPGNIELAEELVKQNVTTLMIKNLPTSLQQPQVLEELHNSGFEGRYDFFYMPGTFGNNRSLGYAFVNLINVETMKEFMLTWHNTQRLGATGLPLKLSAADVQGREANSQNFGPRMRRIRNPCLRPVILEPKRSEAAEA